MQATKFVLTEIVERDIFPYRIQAYSIKVGENWVDCSFTEDVNMYWFGQRQVTILKDE